MNYVHDVDNYVISVNRSDVPVTWYRDVTDDATDDDGMVVLRRGIQRLSWNSLGQLTRVTSGRVHSSYVYDADGRLTVVNDMTSTLHLFYSDLRHAHRITHIHHSNTDCVTEYFYDESDGHLQAARLNGHVMLYVAVDPHGSPVYVLNATGNIIRQMSYTPVGGLHQHSSESDIPWYIGYRGAFHHATIDLVFFATGVLDPDNGRWLSPNYQPFIDRRRHSLMALIRNADPYETNFLRHGDVTPPSLMLSKLHGAVTDSNTIQTFIAPSDTTDLFVSC